MGLLLLLLPFSALALVNINTATLAELDTLPGVGPATAQKIIDARPFASTSEIQNVQGIGAPGTKTYDEIIDLITVSGSTVTTEDVEDSKNTASSESGSSETTTSGSEKKVMRPVSGLILEAPDYAFIGQAVQFDVSPKDGDQNRFVRYRWNFGDGHTDDSKTVTHEYSHPGTYIVVVESYYLKDTQLARHELTVSMPQISLQTGFGSVTITNENDEEIDLSSLRLSGTTDWNFPEHSILLPGSSLTVDASVVGNVSVVRLLGASGKVLASSAAATTVTELRPTTHTPAPRISAVSTNVSSRVIDQSPTSSAEKDEQGGADKVGNSQTASLPGADIPGKSWPYLGLMAVISLGLFAVWKGKAL